MALADPLLQTYIECACAGKMACSVRPAAPPSFIYCAFLRGFLIEILRTQTCHVILSAEHFAQIGPPLPAEDDMLDLAYGLTDTSRLGCQIELTKEMDGMTVTVPDGVNNMW